MGKPRRRSNQQSSGSMTPPSEEACAHRSLFTDTIVMVMSIGGDKRYPAAQCVVATAARDGLAGLQIVAPPEGPPKPRTSSNSSCDADGLLYVAVPWPPTQWLQRHVDRENEMAVRRLAIDLPFPRDATEMLPCDVLLLLEQTLRAYAAPIISSAEAMELIPLHDPHTVPAYRFSLWPAASREAGCKGTYGGGGGGAALALEAMRGYFGESVAFYFAWMQHYNRWLLLPALVGSAITAVDYYAGTTADTNPLVPFFSVFIVCWAIAFVASWEREENVLACRFHSFGWAEGCSSSAGALRTLGDKKAAATSFRDGYHGQYRKNPFTGETEIHYPRKKRLMWQLFSTAVTVAMLTIALLAQVISLNLQGYMRGKHPMLEMDGVSAYADPGAVFDPEGNLFVVPIAVHACSILALNLVYRRVSMWLTTLENYPTDAEHEHAMIVKRVCFEFVDCFAALFYVAFYRRDLQQLRQEIVSLYTFDQVRRIAMETAVPYAVHALTVWWHNGGGARRPPPSAGDTDAAGLWSTVTQQVDLEAYESFDDYMEMTMQYGYVTLFASAFPLAALCSVAGNLLELHSDFLKLKYVVRRPLPRREASIGPWVQVLRLFTYIAVVTNVSVFAYTSNQMQQSFPRYFNAAGEMQDGTEEYVMVSLFAMEHVLLAVVFFVDWWIPRVPYAVVSLMRSRQLSIASENAALLRNGVL